MLTVDAQPRFTKPHKGAEAPNEKLKTTTTLNVKPTQHGGTDKNTTVLKIESQKQSVSWHSNKTTSQDSASRSGSVNTTNTTHGPPGSVNTSSFNTSTKEKERVSVTNRSVNQSFGIKTELLQGKKDYKDVPGPILHQTEMWENVHTQKYKDEQKINETKITIPHSHTQNKTQKTMSKHKNNSLKNIKQKQNKNKKYGGPVKLNRHKKQNPQNSRGLKKGLSRTELSRRNSPNERHKTKFLSQNSAKRNAQPKISRTVEIRGKNKTTLFDTSIHSKPGLEARDLTASSYILPKEEQFSSPAPMLEVKGTGVSSPPAPMLEVKGSAVSKKKTRRIDSPGYESEGYHILAPEGSGDDSSV